MEKKTVLYIVFGIVGALVCAVCSNLVVFYYKRLDVGVGYIIICFLVPVLSMIGLLIGNTYPGKMNETALKIIGGVVTVVLPLAALAPITMRFSPMPSWEVFMFLGFLIVPFVFLHFVLAFRWPTPVAVAVPVGWISWILVALGAAIGLFPLPNLFYTAEDVTMNKAGFAVTALITTVALFFGFGAGTWVMKKLESPFKWAFGKGVAVGIIVMVVILAVIVAGLYFVFLKVSGS